MRILCIDQFSELGGAQRCLLDLLPGFLENGWHAQVVLPNSGSFSSALERDGYSVWFLRTPPYSSCRKPAREMLRYGLDFPRIARALSKRILGQRADLLYINGPRLLPPAALAARSWGIPLIFHCHSQLLQRSAVTLVRRSLALSKAHLLACCNYVAEPLRRSIPYAECSVIYNGVAEAAVLHEFRFPLRHIGVLGRIEPEKGQLEFVRAARLIARQFPNCIFHIIGAPLFSDQGYHEQVRCEAAGLPVRFSGWQQNAAASLASLDLLVVPSARIEATTRVILEAYSAGVPVVAFPSGGIPEIVRDEQTGFLAGNHTIEALAERIAFVLRLSPSPLRWIIENGQAAWRSRYTVRHYRDQVCALISRLDRRQELCAYTVARTAR